MFQHVLIPGAGFLYDILAVERGPVYAATDVHAYLESVIRGKPARRPKPWRG
jgi:hypothetical protein